MCHFYIHTKTNKKRADLTVVEVPRKLLNIEFNLFHIKILIFKFSL